MCSIAISRTGLSEMDFRVILRKSENEPLLTASAWSRLYSAIEGFLGSRTGEGTDVVYHFFHHEMDKAVRKRYFEHGEKKEDQKAHRLLALYYLSLADPGNF